MRVRVEPRSCVLHVGGGTLPNNSPQKIYLNFRNNLCMLFKNLSPLSFWPVLFARMALDGRGRSRFSGSGAPRFFQTDVPCSHRLPSSPQLASSEAARDSARPRGPFALDIFR